MNPTGLRLELSGLSRTFAGKGGVSDVSVRVPDAAIYVLCGANGAGKTTTISVIAGLLFAQPGSLLLQSRAIPLDRDARRPGLGFVPDHPYLDSELTAVQWLAFVRQLKRCGGVIAQEEVADALRLSASELRLPIRELSFGTRRKVALWTEFASCSSLLLLDEPLIGLDPPSIAGFQWIAERFASTGSSILMSTHLLAEAETIATHVGVLSSGRTVLEGRLEDVVGDATLLEAVMRGEPSSQSGHRQ